MENYVLLFDETVLRDSLHEVLLLNHKTMESFTYINTRNTYLFTHQEGPGEDWNSQNPYVCPHFLIFVV